MQCPRNAPTTAIQRSRPFVPSRSKQIPPLTKHFLHERLTPHRQPRAKRPHPLHQPELGFLATLRFLLTFAKDPDPAVVAMFRARALAALDVLERQLAARDWVALDRPSIADLSLCGYLWYQDEFGVDWAAYPSIGAWLGRLQAMPGWAHPYVLMPGHPLPARG